MKMNPKAWAILTEDEQLALQLNLGMRKSTWKAGEIMKKSHYKLIEIKDRARTFLKIFTNHYLEYGKLIPDNVRISPDLRDYLKFCIEKRMPIFKAIRELDNPLFHHMSTRDKVIHEEIMRWKSSVKIPEKELFNLVLEFDRWNNFRILPKSLQEPSAFKRRDKNRLKKHLKIATNISELSLKVIKDRFEYTSKKKINEGFLVLISDVPRKAFIFRIKASPDNLKDLGKVSLYVFPTSAIAEDYMQLVVKYIDEENKHCREGLKFWPKYREIIKEALNYDIIQNIIPSRKNLEFSQTD